jgi:hypothetical protein
MATLVRVLLLMLCAACRVSETPTADPEALKPVVFHQAALQASYEPVPIRTEPPPRPAPMDPRGILVPCTGASCGVIEGSVPVVYFEQKDDGTPLKAEEAGDWACFDAVVVPTGTQLGQCFHRVSECETARAEMADNPDGLKLETTVSEKCFGSRKAACSFGTESLVEARMPSCWSNFAACELFARELAHGSVGNKNWKDMTSCEAVLPTDWR